MWLSDQTARIRMLIWSYIIRIWNKNTEVINKNQNLADVRNVPIMGKINMKYILFIGNIECQIYFYICILYKLSRVV